MSDPALTESVLNIRPASETRWDCASFGEVMLRFDPGFGRVRNARQFNVWEGGGEYNVARAMRKCWDKRATAVTALPINDLGWLVEDLMMQGGVDQSHVIWREFDGLGRNTRVGLNFTEKGFGVRPALGCSDLRARCSRRFSHEGRSDRSSPEAASNAPRCPGRAES